MEALLLLDLHRREDTAVGIESDQRVVLPAQPEQIAKGPFVDFDLFDPLVDEIGAREAIGAALGAESAARAYDARITNTQAASFSRATGTSAVVLSGGFRNAWRG